VENLETFRQTEKEERNYRMGGEYSSTIKTGEERGGGISQMYKLMKEKIEEERGWARQSCRIHLK